MSDALAKPVARRRFAAQNLQELQGVGNPVAGEGIDLDAFLVGEQEFEFRWIEVQGPPFVHADVLQERNLEVQPRLGDDPHRVAELQHDRLFGLMDREQRRRRQHAADDDDNSDNRECDLIHEMIFPVV